MTIEKPLIQRKRLDRTTYCLLAPGYFDRRHLDETTLRANLVMTGRRNHGLKSGPATGKLSLFPTSCHWVSEDGIKVAQKRGKMRGYKS